ARPGVVPPPDRRDPLRPSPRCERAVRALPQRVRDPAPGCRIGGEGIQWPEIAATSPASVATSAGIVPALPRPRDPMTSTRCILLLASPLAAIGMALTATTGVVEVPK